MYFSLIKSRHEAERLYDFLVPLEKGHILGREGGLHDDRQT